MTSTSATVLVEKLLDHVKVSCETDDEGLIKVLREGFAPAVEEFVASLSSGQGQVPVSSKRGKSSKTEVAEKVKEKKLRPKNPYHFFVADKMGEVKAQGVPAPERMKTLGGMWKELSDEGKVVYNDRAKKYNDFIVEAQTKPDWATRIEEIQRQANALVGMREGQLDTESVVEAATQVVSKPVEVPETVAETEEPAKPAAKAKATKPKAAKTK